MWDAVREQPYVDNIHSNLEQISNDFQHAITSNNFDLPLKLLMNAIYNAAQYMKKRDNTLKHSASRKDNKPWFDTECDQYRKRAISALKQFRIVASVGALEHYKHAKNEYMNIIRYKIPKYLERRRNLLSEAASDKNPKTFWTLLKAHRKPVCTDIKLDDWFNHFSQLLNPDQDDVFQNEFNNQDDKLYENEYLDSQITKTRFYKLLRILSQENLRV